MQLGDVALYNAAIDIRDVPAPAETVIDARNAASEQVFARCMVEAKLESLGGSFRISAEPSEDDGWAVRQFSPDGVAEWAWHVRAVAPGKAQQLILRVRPILYYYGADRVGASSSSRAFSTTVNVSASWLEHTSAWFEADFSEVKKIASTLGSVVITVMAWALLFSERAVPLLEKLRVRKTRKHTDEPAVE